MILELRQVKLTKARKEPHFEIIHTDQEGVTNNQAEKAASEIRPTVTCPVREEGNDQEEDQGADIDRNSHQVGRHRRIAKATNDSRHERRQTVEGDVDGELVGKVRIPLRVLERLDALAPGELVVIAPGRISIIARLHHLLLLWCEEPSLRRRLGEDEPEDRHNDYSHGSLNRKEPSPALEVGSADLGKTVCKQAAERAGEGAKGKDE